MGRRKKAGNGVAATVKSLAAKRATKKANGAKPSAPGETVKLTAGDKRWFENLMLKEQLVKQESQAKMLRLIEDEKDMFAAIEKRTGVDIKKYELDWLNLLATPKAEPEAKAKAKAKPGPKPKQAEQVEPQPEAEAEAEAS